MVYNIEHINEDHNVKGFSCGLATVDSYIRNFARRNASSNLGQTYVLVEQDSRDVFGYYTLCSFGVATKDVPELDRGRIKYPSIPATLIARLGVLEKYKGESCQGKGLGRMLLVHAFGQSCRAAQIMGVNLIVVHAANERAKAFYTKYNFAELLSNPLHLYIPVRAVESLAKSV